MTRGVPAGSTSAAPYRPRGQIAIGFHRRALTDTEASPPDHSLRVSTNRVNSSPPFVRTSVSQSTQPLTNMRQSGRVLRADSGEQVERDGAPNMALGQHRHDGGVQHANRGSQYNSVTCGKKCREMGMLRLNGLTSLSTSAIPETARA